MRRRAEIGLLVALCFFLPLYEAPKNLAWAAYVLMWLANRAAARDFGGRWDLWDTLLAVWLASGFAVAAGAGLHGSEWRGALDLVRYGGVLWLVKRTRFTIREQQWLLGSLVASTLVALAMGYAALWRGTEPTLQLNSVGHVNHSAIYLAIMLGLCASWLFAGRRPLLASAAVLILLVSLFVTASRGAIGIALIMLVVIAAGWWRRSRVPIVAAAALVTLTLVVGWFGGAEVFRKHQAVVEAHNVLAYRDGIWRAALVAWQRFPLFGIGIDNYHLVKLERVQRWRREAGLDFEAQRYAEFPHAHSLYLNTLAERGIVGSAPLLAVLAAWLVSLLRHLPQREAPDEDAIWWGAAAGAWLVTTGVGLVNTTLHHEHAILAMLLLGFWLSRLRRSSAMPL